METLRAVIGDGVREGMVVTNPTAENPGASSYSVKEMLCLCRAIANARPAMPAPVVDR